ncbi:MAG: glycosyltransferase family 2 protein, partial [Spirulinaceae cyanobacterium]
AQTIPCEVIVVDDCSDDGTQDYVTTLIKKTGNKSLIYYRNPVNLGHSQSVNAGVKIATGEWIKFLDDDDYLAPNCLKEIAKVISLHPQGVICSVQAAQVDENEVEITRTRQINSSKAFYIPQEDIHYGMLLEMVPFGTPVQVACRRDAFLESGGWDSGLDANFDDIDSWIKIAQFGDAIFINECLAYRTIWSGAYNHKFSLEKRLETNLLIKQSIHALIHSKHRSYTPAIETIARYLKLHWSLVALKQVKFSTAFKLMFPNIFFWSAWQLILGKAGESYRNRNLHQITIKQDIDKVAQEQQSYREIIEQIRSYLKLRWGFKAFQKGEFSTGIQIALSALFSSQVWGITLAAAFPKIYQENLELKKQLNQNILVMEAICSLLNDKHQETLPNLQELKKYLKVRLFLLAFREGKISVAMRLALPTILSPVVWKLLSRIAILTRISKQKPIIRRFVLLES